MDRLNLAFQQDDVNLSTIRPRDNGTISCLEQLLQQPFSGTREQGFIEEFHKTNGIYWGQSLTYKSEISVQAYCQVRDDFIRAPVDNLKKRFPETDLYLLQSLGQLLESRNFPQADYELRNYGSDELGVVTAHCTPFLDTDRLQAEFMQFKFTLRAQGRISFADTCRAVLTNHKDVFPEFAKLANVAFAIPVSIVPCERGFSVQNRIKRLDRSRLTDRHVDNLMLIAMEGPLLRDSNDTISRACNLFKERKDRCK